MAAYGVVLPYGDIVFGVDAGCRGSKVERFASTLSMTTSPDGVTQWDLGVGCGLMDPRRTVVSSDVMVTLDGRKDENYTYLYPKFAQRFDGGDNFFLACV
jgi:hypothetical protein